MIHQVPCQIRVDTRCAVSVVTVILFLSRKVGRQVLLTSIVRGRIVNSGNPCNPIFIALPLYWLVRTNSQCKRFPMSHHSAQFSPRIGTLVELSIFSSSIYTTNSLTSCGNDDATWMVIREEKCDQKQQTVFLELF